MVVLQFVFSQGIEEVIVDVDDEFTGVVIEKLSIRKGEVQDMQFTYGKASADTGDVSWNAPLAAVRAATWVPGTPPHSWQAVAAGGTSIGSKGMMVAAKTMALTAIDIYKSPKLLDAIKAEFNERRGADFKYEALLGDRKPALDYRK